MPVVGNCHQSDSSLKNQATRNVMILWLASYPRSGNTFLRMILKQAFDLDTHSVHKGDQSSIGREPQIGELIGHKALRAETDFDDLRDSGNLSAIKTHHTWQTFSTNYHPADKIIYILRDGRESTLSYFHYLRKYTSFRGELGEIILDRATFRSWATNVQSWLDVDVPRLIIKYENLVKDVHNHIDILQDYIGIEKKAYHIPTFDELQSIDRRFFRSGKNDSWKEAYSTEELDLFWIFSADTMFAAGYPDNVPNGIEMDAARRNRQLLLGSTYSRAILGNDSLKESFKGLTDTRAFFNPLRKYRCYRAVVRELSGILRE